MIFRKEKERTKICPRCGLKVYEGIETCPDCGLVFSRLEIATNKEAKRKKMRGDRDFIINTTQIPSDVSYIKLLLLCIFLGPVGAHNFYVGRYLKGSVLLVDFIILFLMVAFNSQLIAAGGEELVGTISTILGMIMLMWFWDLFMIVVKKYKIPVAIDIEYDLQNLSEEKTEDDSLKTASEIKENTNFSSRENDNSVNKDNNILDNLEAKDSDNKEVEINDKTDNTKENNEKSNEVKK